MNIGRIESGIVAMGCIVDVISSYLLVFNADIQKGSGHSYYIGYQLSDADTGIHGNLECKHLKFGIAKTKQIKTLYFHRDSSIEQKKCPVKKRCRYGFYIYL